MIYRSFKIKQIIGRLYDAHRKVEMSTSKRFLQIKNYFVSFIQLIQIRLQNKTIDLMSYYEQSLKFYYVK